jgi:hypothetical protein
LRGYETGEVAFTIVGFGVWAGRGLGLREWVDAQAVEVEFGDGAGDGNGAGGVEGREFGYFVVMF